MERIREGYTQNFRGTNIPTGECLDWFDVQDLTTILKYDPQKEEASLQSVATARYLECLQEWCHGFETHPDIFIKNYGLKALTQVMDRINEIRSPI